LHEIELGGDVYRADETRDHRRQLCDATVRGVDGVLIPQLPNYDVWAKVDTVDIPADTRVIAVKGRDVGVSFFLI